MNMNFDVSLSQRLTMSQSQIQSLEILAMDSQELNQFLQEEYLENPILDYTGENAGLPKVEDLSNTYESETFYGRNYEESAEAEDERKKDIADESPDELKNYLQSQLVLNHYTQPEWKLIDYLIDCLDDNGYFTMPPAEIATINKIPLEIVEKCLADLRQLEPYGIFAKDLRHCLLRQIEVMEEKDVNLYTIIKDHLSDVAEGKISNISRALGLSTVQVRKYIEQISRLDPRPLTGYGRERASFIVPDIIFCIEDGKWDIELNDKWIKDYKINDYYLKMMNESKDEELASYFKMKLDRVRFIMNSIEQRRNTIHAIAEVTLQRQKKYLEGKDTLQPMTMAEVAEILGVHPSTVSRAVKGKYVQSPKGSLSMKDLFTLSSSKEDNETGVTAAHIKMQMKEIVRAEDRRKPYSDQQIAELLKKKNISISRRAVAKYREELGIKGSYDRKIVVLEE